MEEERDLYDIENDPGDNHDHEEADNAAAQPTVPSLIEEAARLQAIDHPLFPCPEEEKAELLLIPSAGDFDNRQDSAYETFDALCAILDQDPLFMALASLLQARIKAGKFDLNVRHMEQRHLDWLTYKGYAVYVMPTKDRQGVEYYHIDWRNRSTPTYGG